MMYKCVLCIVNVFVYCIYLLKSKLLLVGVLCIALCNWQSWLLRGFCEFVACVINLYSFSVPGLSSVSLLP